MKRHAALEAAAIFPRPGHAREKEISLALSHSVVIMIEKCHEFADPEILERCAATGNERIDSIARCNGGEVPAPRNLIQWRSKRNWIYKASEKRKNRTITLHYLPLPTGFPLLQFPATEALGDSSPLATS